MLYSLTSTSNKSNTVSLLYGTTAFARVQCSTGMDITVQGVNTVWYGDVECAERRCGLCVCHLQSDSHDMHTCNL